eukprot:PhF_6_TR9186/c0_g1_i1/m.14333/K01137/GNS; N-acetylglucosamine-6-sulfatase
MLLVVSLFSFVVMFVSSVTPSPPPPPNIVFLLTDDQDISTLDHMPRLKKMMGDMGTQFTHMYASVPVCCPSRASLWTGTYQHNNHVVGNDYTTNCSSLSWQHLSEPHTIPVFLKQAGYVTSFAGKYLNGYGYPNVGGTAHVPPGWDNWQGLVGNSIYYDYTLSNNGKSESHGSDYATDYLPDLVVNRTLDFLRQPVNQGKPFFAVVSTPSCHDPADSAPRYQSLLPDLKAPRTPAWNASTPDAHWFQAVQGLYGLTNNSVNFVDLKYRRRALTLMTVEDMLEALIEQVTDMGVLNNTYFIYTSDNGYHFGTYGLIYDKRQPWETDILLPMFLRGPGIPSKLLVDNVVSMPDLSATILELAGVTLPSSFDGQSFVVRNSNSGQVSLRGGSEGVRRMALVEYHGEGLGGDMGPGCKATAPYPEMSCWGNSNFSTPPYWYGHDVCACQDCLNNTYNCLRFLNDTHNFRYCEFHDRVHKVEYYDYLTDPYGLTNLAKGMDVQWQTTLHNRLSEAVVCVGSEQCKDALTRNL